MKMRFLLIPFCLMTFDASAQHDDHSTSNVYGSHYNNYSNQLGGNNYNSKTGNHYETKKDYLGNTKVYGHNERTGSKWDTTIKPSGDMKGHDKEGNHWAYDKSAKSYSNTGKSHSLFGD